MGALWFWADEFQGKGFPLWWDGLCHPSSLARFGGAGTTRCNRSSKERNVLTLLATSYFGLRDHSWSCDDLGEALAYAKAWADGGDCWPTQIIDESGTIILADKELEIAAGIK